MYLSVINVGNLVDPRCDLSADGRMQVQRLEESESIADDG